MKKTKNDQDKVTAGQSELASSADKKKKFMTYGGITAALVFGLIGAYALLSSHAEVRIKSNHISTAQTLATGEAIGAPNANPPYRLIMQGDGNLVVYRDSGHATWSSHTAHTGSHNKLVLQSDGNLVIYAGTKAVWSSRTKGLGTGTSLGITKERLVMQADGNLVIYAYNPSTLGYTTPIWSTGTGILHPYPTQLNKGQALKAGQSIATSAFHPKYRLTMQKDGNLVLYDSSKHAIWNTRTARSGSHNRLVLQGDGNLVVYSGARAVWNSGTNKGLSKPVKLIIHFNANNKGKAAAELRGSLNQIIWQSNPLSLL